VVIHSVSGTVHPLPDLSLEPGTGELMATTVLRSERFPDLGDEVLFPRLSDARSSGSAKRGERRTFQPGEVLYEHAVRDAPFYVIDQRRVEFVDRKPARTSTSPRPTAHVHRRHRRVHRRADDQRLRRRRADRRDRFDRAALRDCSARWPEFGEHVFRTLLARRAWHEAEGHGVMRLIAARGSRRAFEVATCSSATCCPVRWYDVDTDDESARCSTGSRSRARRRRCSCTPPT
jgi:thioredoxin reductase (NADPH)